jgi:hypothetical protein
LSDNSGSLDHVANYFKVLFQHIEYSRKHWKLVRHTNRKLLLKSIEEAGLDYEALVQNELCCVTVSDICNPDDGREKNIR